MYIVNLSEAENYANNQWFQHFFITLTYFIDTTVEISRSTNGRQKIQNKILTYNPKKD